MAMDSISHLSMEIRESVCLSENRHPKRTSCITSLRCFFDDKNQFAHSPIPLSRQTNTLQLPRRGFAITPRKSHPEWHSRNSRDFCPISPFLSFVNDNF